MMKLKLLSCIALLTVLCASQALALYPNPWVTVDNPWDPNIIGYQITYQNGPGSAVYWGDYQPDEDFPDPDGRADMGSTAQYYLDEMGTYTDDGKTFDLRPETNFFVLNPSNDTIPSNTFRNVAETDGEVYVDSLTFYERIIIGTETNVVMEFVLNDFDFDTNRYEVVGFFKVVNPLNGNPVFGPVETNLALATPGVPITFQLQTNYAVWDNQNIQVGFRVSGTNASPTAANSLGSANVTVTDLRLEAPDFIAPDPDPLTWKVEPFALSDDKIEMEVTTATDPSGVEYQFLGYTGGIPPGKPLAFDSGWVDSPFYVATNLAANTTYGIRARARDKAVTPNITSFTPWVTPTTAITDTGAPLPSPAVIQSAVPSPISIWLTAQGGTDSSPVIEYNFVPANTNNGATASGWQRSNEYLDYGLVPGTSYDYTVQMRDLSAVGYTGLVSAVETVVTLPAPASIGFSNDLKGFTPGTNTIQLTHELAMAGFELAAPLNEVQFVSADGNGLTFGPYEGTNGTSANRNVLRTIASSYAAGDFTLEVTFAYSNQIEQVAFVGAGPGEQGEFGVPDYFFPGNGGFVSETSAAWQKLFTWKGDGTEVVPIFGDNTTNELVYLPGVTTITNRIRISYDSATTNCLYEIDYDADGFGGFISDTNLGPVTLTNVWELEPIQRLYIGGGAGTTFFDLVITSANVPSVPVTDLTIVSVSGDDATLQWTGLSGQTYNVQYKTDLNAATWTDDPGNLDITGSGILNPVSTVVGDEVFYRVESE